MPAFGIVTRDEQAIEFMKLYAERMENPFVQVMLDGKVKQYSEDLFVIVIEPRVPPLHYIGLGIGLFAVIMGWSTLWVWIPVGILLSWALFWTKLTYYGLLQLGRYRQTGYAGGTKLLGTNATLWRMMQ
jgi:hypothetical protein